MVYKRTVNRDIPNIGIIANNKLIELQNQFREAGISIYSSNSIIGEAIIEDMVELVKKGGSDFLTYLNIVEEIDNEKNEQIKAVEKVSPLRKLFKPKQPNVVPYTEEEQAKIDFSLSKYIDTTNQMWEYNLSNNLVTTIITKFLRKNYEVNDILELLDKSIIPDLQKLGLSNKISEIKENLIEEYKKDLSKKRFFKTNEELFEDNVVKSEDLKRLDEAVPASDRQRAIVAIQSELKEQTQENKEQVTNNDSGVCLE